MTKKKTDAEAPKFLKEKYPLIDAKPPMELTTKDLKQMFGDCKPVIEGKVKHATPADQEFIGKAGEEFERTGNLHYKDRNYLKFIWQNLPA